MKRKNFHIKIIYLKLFGEVSSYDNPPFTLLQKFIRANFEEKNGHPKNVVYFLSFYYNFIFLLQLEYQFELYDNWKTGFQKDFFLSGRLLLGCSGGLYETII